MPSIIEEERGIASGRGLSVIDHKRGHMEQISPIVLSGIDEEAKELFDLVIHSFDHSIGLRMISSGGIPFNVQQSVEFLDELIDKLNAAVGYDFTGHAILRVDMITEKCGILKHCHSKFCDWFGYHHACKFIHDNQDSIEPIANGQFGDEVNGNDFPGDARNVVGIQLGGGSRAPGFTSLTGYTTPDVISDVSLQVGPPVDVADKFICLVHTAMTHTESIMMFFYDFLA